MGKIFFKTLLTIRGCAVILAVTIIIIDYETPQRRSTPWKAPGGKAKSDAIREILLASYDHPSVEEIYRRLKPDIPDLSLGTVYRNLALFREEGKAMSVATVAGQERFDGRTHPHAHFICEKCGRVDDVDVVLPETLVTGEMPGEVRSWALTFYGICRCCAADDNKNNKEKN